MIDRKKVMEGLSYICNEIVDGYINEPERAVNTLTDALELLKEQEPVKPNPVHNSARWFACGKCDCSITMEDKFCPRCGREVKWDYFA